MSEKSFRPKGRAHRLAGSLSAAILLIGLSACQTSGPSDITGSLGDTVEQGEAPVDPRRDIETYHERLRANPKDADAALKYARALRATGQRAQAVAVMEQAVLAQPSNKALLAGYGRALADNGNFQQAFDVLGRAHTPEDPDWRILSAQGAVLDQLDRHDEARQYYASALKIVPDEPSVLSNLGLSYMLAKDLPKAEETLRRARERAPRDMRVRTNLAVVVGLQGRSAEAETIMKADLAPAEGAANVAALKKLLARKEAVRAGADKIPVAASHRVD
ncbi:tetratricopeptide repeat protein [Bradyrhizobium genosp. L]|uniref:tetratricopeptide repeat protein n=1 Tax=Bradyrhizobium genosp. L TaxID=83637 RepID=UPI0018A26F73|nr:tetratricopeptide repeat protein [Bradyrhizobium genosp. L]QPF81733.1 tetratricopeptide repeat protein [Bradyrhizobium genosp. L]